MAAPRNRKHILIRQTPRVDSYTPHGGGGKDALPSPAGGRSSHGAALKTAILQAETHANARRAASGITVHGATPGVYIQFESQPDVELNIPSLEDRRKGIEVVAVTETTALESSERGSGRIQHASVFVPEGQIKHFVTRFEQYALPTPKKKGEKRHEDMIDRIAALRLATLRALWTDAPEAYPDETSMIWWEIWLRRTDGRELERLHEFAGFANLRLGARRLEFDDRIVALVHASPVKLSLSLDVMNDVAEVRRAKELASFFSDQRGEEQAEWVNDLRDRLVAPPGTSPVVCVLDTGITQEHPLLRPAVLPGDVHSIEPRWGTADDGGGPGMAGHGTEMAGIALYGDLGQVLASVGPVALRHGLESVKILPPPRFPASNPELYGAITATAVSYPEVQAPDRKRVFSMAVTADDQRDRGQPTSWSAAIDALAAGRSFDATKQGLVYLDDAGDRRLFVISAGNVPAVEASHLERSDLEPVHDPAQAWNALTVGAYTDLAMIQDPRWSIWRPLASAGELSPYSTTSVGFSAPWPIKPDVVAEGGNVVVNGKGEVDFPVPDLSLLTTYFQPWVRPLVCTWATSPACAQVARLCALIAAEYPDYWAETIRALVVHSAGWTPMMQRHLRLARGKRARLSLVRRYGFGVPRLERALRSANDALTLVAQGTIRPFLDGKMREMNVFDLPWPKVILENLGGLRVRLRVTLSYFVEPNPARVGWQRRHRYQSHGLRFDVKGPLESMDAFLKRLNKRALEEEEERPGAAADAGWFLGEQARNRGSLHADIWQGTAADLAERGVVAVYPVTGWWKEQKARDRSEHGARYSLVVSIETPGVDVDIWTPVAQQVGIPVEVEAAAQY